MFFNSIDDIIKNPILRVLCRKHFGVCNKSRKQYPFRFIWYRLLCKSMGLAESDFGSIILYDWGLLAKDMCYIKYIKKHLPNIRLVYLFSNIVSISGAVHYGTIRQLNLVYDKVFAFDPNDAIRYGFDYSPLIYTKDPDYKESKETIDVFYIGNAKDRLDILHEIYQKCIELQLICCFYINAVPLNKQLFKGIHYNQPLSYQEVLSFISRSRCMVDAIQGNSRAMTIKVCEAVVYNKKLITTNENIKKEPYYSPQMFLVYNSQSNIFDFLFSENTQFTDNERRIFSPVCLFNKIYKTV